MVRHQSVTRVNETSLASPNRDDFAAMLEESFVTQSPAEGAVIKGKVVAIENDFAIVDVGLKTEGRVSLKEFSMPGVPADCKGRRRSRSLSRAGRERAGRSGAVARQGAARGKLDPAWSAPSTNRPASPA